MCGPAAAVFVAMSAASTMMAMKASNDQAAQTRANMETRNKILAQENAMKVGAIQRDAKKAEGRAIAAGGMSGIGLANAETSALDFASESGRATYATNLRTSLEQGINSTAAMQAGINAQTKNIGSMFSFGKSVAGMGMGTKASDWGLDFGSDKLETFEHTSAGRPWM
jgi:hypothetical protein